jgi:replicative DNA helicase
MERLKNPERLMTVDFARLAAAVEKINKCQMHTVCCKKASVSEIKRWARTLRAKSHMDIGLIIIDHPSLIPGRKGAGKGVQEISKTLLSLKSLAGQLEVPIVVFSKLNKRFSSGPDIYSLEKSSDTGFYKDIVIFCPL